ncbi:hypothetical protein, partial [Limnospira platensis]|uniref:hypothetical protein n=1 Tax=Limnospira platensis TaxID=118562 RepID=UPI00396C866C
SSPHWRRRNPPTHGIKGLVTKLNSFRYAPLMDFTAAPLIPPPALPNPRHPKSDRPTSLPD